MADIFQSIDGLDADALQKVIDRLEFRGTYAPFIAMREAYLDRLDLPPRPHICELGCGTGVVSRAIAARPEFDGTVHGTDLSEALVAEAKRRARSEGVENVTFSADAEGGSGQSADSCDVVILHTLISHVASVAPVLAEASRIAKPGATIVVFDGDYASLTCHCGDASEDARIVGSLLGAIVANPTVMRDLPRLMQKAGLVLDGVRGDLLVEAGEPEFFGSLIESYVPMAVRAGMIADREADAWLGGFRTAGRDRFFFGSCNFVTYFAKAV
jgi:2-polyprenyl-3-methyl-5-hydroxy-6-metoxy-1,4-benzoquinol methylase